MRISRQVFAAACALALALSVGRVPGVAGQVTTAAAAARTDRSANAYRETLTQELVADIAALRAQLLAAGPHVTGLADQTSAIVTRARLLGALSFELPQSGVSYGTRAQALQAAAERLDEAAHTGDRAVALGHLQILTGTLGALQASFGPALPAQPTTDVVNAN